MQVQHRTAIFILLQNGTKKKDIAKAINVSPSTISREIKRNSGHNGHGAIVTLTERSTNMLFMRKLNKGKYTGCWECHLEPDWLLIWRQNDYALVLILVDTGTHSDLF